MATFTPQDLNTRPMHMGQYGEADIIKWKLTPTAGATADIFRAGKIPAGFEVHEITLANNDLDSNGSPTIVFGMGYTPVSANDGALVASPAYFVAAGDATLQAANGGKVYSLFDAIKFEQDVFLDLLLGTGAATFAAGSLWVVIKGRNVGVK